jgi:hypothetical protein
MASDRGANETDKNNKANKNKLRAIALVVGVAVPAIVCAGEPRWPSGPYKYFVIDQRADRVRAQH